MEDSTGIMMFIKLTYDDLANSSALVCVDKIKYVIETDDVATIWMNDDVQIDVRESVSDIQRSIWEEIKRMNK